MIVYLVATCGYMDSVLQDRCAVDAEGVKQIISDYRGTYFYDKIRNVQVDFGACRVTYECKPDWDEDWDQEEYVLIPLEVVEQTVNKKKMVWRCNKCGGGFDKAKWPPAPCCDDWGSGSLFATCPLCGSGDIKEIEKG